MYMRNHLYILFDWIFIILAIFGFNYYYNVLSFFFMVIILASRMHALFSDMHEASHGNLFKNSKINTIFSTIFCSFPLGHNFHYFKQYHLMHHRFLNTEFDPSFLPMRNNPEWNFPMSKKQFMKIVIRDLIGLNFYTISYYESVYKKHNSTIQYLFERYGFYLLLFMLNFAFTENVSKSLFVLLSWVFAKYTLLVLFVRLRTIAEHSGLENEEIKSRDVKGNFLENFFIFPHHVGLHSLHHDFPHKPSYIHKELESKKLTSSLFGNQGLLTQLLK